MLRGGHKALKRNRLWLAAWLVPVSPMAAPEFPPSIDPGSRLGRMLRGALKFNRSEQDSEAEPEVPLIEHPSQRGRGGDLAEPVQVLQRPIAIQLRVGHV